MALFYGLYIADKQLAGALDLIRFLAEPKFFRRAHVTVRGPYVKRITKHLRDLEGSLGSSYVIDVIGLGSFFTGKQNTVFLQCEIQGIERIWKKPDYRGQITPHLTLYDGKSRQFGYSFLHQLEKYRWQFSAPSTNLSLVETKRVPSESLDLFFDDSLRVNDRIFGRHIDYRKLWLQNERERLTYISWVCQFIEENYSQTQKEHRG